MSQLDGAYDLLANSRRRYLLQFLRENGEEATIETLATELAAWERDESVEDVDDTARKRARIALVHKHLPKLADHDVVAYDQETVVHVETPRELESLLEIDAPETRVTEDTGEHSRVPSWD